jgi:hypothetical protein
VPPLLNASFMTLPLWLLVFGWAQLRAPGAGSEQRNLEPTLAAG